MWRNGPAFGTVLWVMCLALNAMAVALTLAFRSRWLGVVLIFTGR
ncbi:MULTISPECIES: DUF3325 family protein [Massilia]